jgi:hypothetical protein
MRRLSTAFLVTCLLGVVGGSAALAQSESPSPFAPGPPYPEPIEGISVYDYAAVLDEDTILTVEATIEAIQARSGVEVVVFSQIKPESDTLEESTQDAAALLEQWGVGRWGANDGLVILFDLQPDRCHGQAQLYAGTGFNVAHMNHDERQATFEQEMLPRLQQCELDAALLAAMERIDSAIIVPDTVPVEEVFPAEIGGRPFTAADVDVLRGESDILYYLFGDEPYPEQVVGLMNLAGTTGNTIDDMTQVWGGLETASGDRISLAGIQIPGADTAAIRRATGVWGMGMMSDPAYDDIEIDGKQVTVFHTEETLGSPNYLYADGDIAWLFSAHESYARDILEALPG